MTALNGLRILVAEDEGLVALELEELLRDFGCEVIGPFSRLDEIVEGLKSPHIDGALLDVNLRGQLVFDVLPQFKERGIPVIITSGYDTKSLFPTEFHDLPRIGKPLDEVALRDECVKAFVRR